MFIYSLLRIHSKIRKLHSVNVEYGHDCSLLLIFFFGKRIYESYSNHHFISL